LYCNISIRRNKINKLITAREINEMSVINFDDVNSITTDQWKYLLYHWHDTTTKRYKKTTEFLYSLGILSGDIAGHKYADTVRQYEWSFHPPTDLKKYKDFYFTVKDAINFYKSTKDDTEVWEIFLYVNMFGRDWLNNGMHIEIRKEDDKCRLVERYCTYEKPTEWITWDAMIEMVNKYIHIEYDEEDDY